MVMMKIHVSAYQVNLILQGGVWQRDEGEAEGTAGPCSLARGHSGAAFQDDGPHRSSPQMVRDTPHMRHFPTQWVHALSGGGTI